MWINRTKITRKQKWKEKQRYGHFKRKTFTRENLAVSKKKKNLKRGTESLLIAAQNNAIRTNYIKARIDKMQQNSKCRLCGNRNETINHIICEYCKLEQKEYDLILQGREVDQLGIVQEIEIWPYCPMVFAQTRTRPGEWGTKTFSRILIQKYIPLSGLEDWT